MIYSREINPLYSIKLFIIMLLYIKYLICKYSTKNLVKSMFLLFLILETSCINYSTTHLQVNTFNVTLRDLHEKTRTKIMQ